MGQHTGTPGGSKEEDVEANECNLRGHSRVVMLVFSASSHTNYGNNELANQHSESTINEECATTKFLNGVERDGGATDVDERGDHVDQERVANGLQLLEEGGSELPRHQRKSPSGLATCLTYIEDEVNTSPLLHHLKRGAKDGAAQVGSRVAESTSEAVEPGDKVSTTWHDRQLIIIIGNDLS